MTAVALVIVVLTTPASAATPIKFLYTTTASYLPLFVAEDQGFFASRGLDVELATVPNATYSTAALMSGSAQVATITPLVTLQADEAGLDLVMIASSDIVPSNSRSGLMARPGSDIHAAKDLIGKRVAVAGIGGMLHVAFRKWLTDQGVDYHQVIFVEAAFPTMGDLLKSGQIDAATSVDPFYERIIATGSGYVVDDFLKSLPDGTVQSYYTTTRAWAVANPQAVAALRAGLAEAVAFIKTNEASARDSLAKFTKLPTQVTATLPLPNFSLTATPEQIRFWIAMGKSQQMLTKDLDAASLIVP
jgi:NitT/TauT family transport system substrate-binding protein